MERQNSGADGGAGTRAKKCTMVEMGQRADPGMLGSGIRRRPSLCCRVFVKRMRRTAPVVVNLTSWRARCRVGLKHRAEVTVKLDLQRKEKNAVQKRPQITA